MSQTPSDGERRHATRHDLKLHVKVDDSVEARTENVSSSGVLLLLPENAEVGTEFTLDMDIPPDLGSGVGRMRFRARVVRVEAREGSRAVAAQLLEWKVVA